MNKVNRTWMAVVAAALLLGTLVGAVWARPNDRPLAQEATRKVTLVGADFTPGQTNFEYVEGGQTTCTAGICYFAAPIDFPTLNAVTVERIRLHVTDNNGTQLASAILFRGKPTEGVYDALAEVSSPAGSSGGLQTYNSAAINKVVWPSQKAYIYLTISGTNIIVHGMTVEYHRNM